MIRGNPALSSHFQNVIVNGNAQLVSRIQVTFPAVLVELSVSATPVCRGGGVTLWLTFPSGTGLAPAVPATFSRTVPHSYPRPSLINAMRS